MYLGMSLMQHRGGQGGAPENACIGNMQTDATWNGHIDGSGSTMIPATTVSGLLVFEFKWDATDLTGDLEFALGPLGNTQEPNANDVLVVVDGRSIILSWDATAERYLGDGIEFTTYMNTLFAVGEEECISVAYLPITLIHYTFTELEMGVA